MKKTSTIFLLIFVASCANVEATPITIIPTKIIPTNTSLSPTPLPSSTPVAEISCDPLTADFCLTEGHFILQRPIHPPANQLVDPSYLYGSTANGTRDPHHGVEFPNPSGTPVHAAADGTVLFAGPDEQAIYAPWANYYGNLVVIEHDADLFTLYAHLSEINVVTNQRVFAGDQIGEVGMTGVAIGSHLHFEVRQGDIENYFATQNPELWLVPAEAPDERPFGALQISVKDQNGGLIEYAEYTIRYYRDKSKKLVKSYYGTTYSADMLNGHENIALGELPTGQYRIAIERNGKVYERWVEVESGKLTQVVFVVK